MKTKSLLLAGAVFGGALFGLTLPAAFSPAQAMTLQEALALAYQTNPTLDARRARLKAVDEQLPQAQSGWRPTVSLSGEAGRGRIETNSSARREQNVDPRQAALTLSQPLYRGGRTVAATNVAEATIDSERALLTATEQTVLLNVATAYMNVVRDRSIVELNTNNVQVLERQLQAARDRFEVGEVTRTDVSQSESRLAAAVANRTRAQADLEASQATFVELVGVAPENLSRTSGELLGNLPASLKEAVDLALDQNPTLRAANHAARAADHGIDLVRGELYPTVSLNGSASRGWDQSSQGSFSENMEVVAAVTVPIYQAGAEYSRLREQKLVAGQRKIEVDEARRQAVTNVTQAWENLTAARARVKSYGSQIDAAQLALEGVRREAEVGSRTILDVLDSEQELLSARVNLVGAQRDEVVTALQLKSALGQMTAQGLNLPVELYDPTVYREYVDGKWFGADVTPND